MTKKLMGTGDGLSREDNNFSREDNKFFQAGRRDGYMKGLEMSHKILADLHEKGLHPPVYLLPEWTNPTYTPELLEA